MTQVTDPVLLKELARQGINRANVDFYQDYAPAYVNGKKVKGQSPYAKFYRDLKSNKRFMVVSGLPRVKPDGIKIEVGWLYTEGKYHSKANLFSAIVDSKQVQVTVLSDQPSGAKKDDSATWQPQLFLNGIEQLSVTIEPVLLATDPTNENYHENVLEWDYGICKRRIRIIEGKFAERWIFDQDPEGEVRIKHNFAGNLPIKLGRYRISDDDELIPREAFFEPAFGYPFTISATATYYPDTNGAGVDGYVSDQGNADFTTTWAIIIDEPGTHAVDDDADQGVIFIIWAHVGAGWINLYRGIAVIDCSDLPVGAIISAATFSVYGYLKVDDLLCTPDSNIYSASPASPTELAPGDFDSLGSTPYCDTPVTYAGFNTGDPGTSNDYVFNAAGIAAVQAAADGNTVVELGFQNANYDVAEFTPNWISYVYSMLCAYSIEKGVGYKPKLVITYEPYTPENKSANMGAKMIAGKLI